jgi:hypothetical protein
LATNEARFRLSNYKDAKSIINRTNRISALKLNDRFAVRPDVKLSVFTDKLQGIFTTNPDVDRNFSEVTENAVRNFLNGPPPLAIGENKLQRNRLVNPPP